MAEIKFPVAETMINCLFLLTSYSRRSETGVLLAAEPPSELRGHVISASYHILQRKVDGLF